MTATASPHVGSAWFARDARALSLEALLDRDAAELDALYAAARVPRLADVRGDLRGRMLAAPILPRPARALARAWAKSRAFPWRGKSFTPRGEDRGEGINRVFVDRLRMYRFETSVGRSRAGGFDAVQLDYDLPENPRFIRPIKDEIRELAPRLYLGRAYLALRSGARFVLFFGLAG